MKDKYRIIQDWCHAPSYFVQKKRWWFPIWTTCYLYASFSTIEDADKAMNRLINPVVKIAD